MTGPGDAAKRVHAGCPPPVDGYRANDGGPDARPPQRMAEEPTSPLLDAPTSATAHPFALAPSLSPSLSPLAAPFHTTPTAAGPNSVAVPPPLATTAAVPATDERL